MKNPWYKKIIDKIQTAFVSRRVRRSKPPVYKMFDNAEILVCPHLRYTRDWYDIDLKEYIDYWIAKDKDPCPDCNRHNCYNCGQSFFSKNRLIIDKAVYSA